MQDHENPPQRIAWNKGKLIGPKPPLRPKHVWSIRTKLNLEGRARDLAMFNLASIASSAAATLSASRSRMSPRTAMRWKGQQCVREEDRAARQIRVERADPRSHRYLCKDDRKEARRISIPKPAQSSWIHYYKAVRATSIGVDSPVLGSTQIASARIHCDGPRQA